jgi:ubiquinone/menaquinone biosynthesis C-methylase UbiE
LKSNSTILLDYGCGNGHALMGVSEKINIGIGIDISEANIEYAKKIAKERKLDNIDFFVMDAMNTTFKNEEFDIIHGSGILHYLNLLLSLNEIKRILKKDGVAIFIEPLDTNLIIKVYRKLTPKVRTKDEQPLRKKDIKFIKSIFPNSELYYYSFFTLFAVPFRKTKHFLKILSILYSVDKILLNRRSPLKWLAWVCILVLKK